MHMENISRVSWGRLLCAVLVLFPLRLKAGADETLIFRRMVYVHALKKTVGAQVWPGYRQTRYAVPMLYYTDSSTYVSNPTAKFLRQVPSKRVFSEAGIVIYKTDKRLDDAPFHMEAYFDEKDTASFYYLTPFMRCSGVEETAPVTKSPPDTRKWSAMVLHEFFHGFQYRHRPFRDFLWRSPVYSGAPGDTLTALYAQFAWFKEGVDAENRTALNLLVSAGRDTAGLRRLLTMAAARRARTRSELGIDITAYEQTLELMEGTARYLEAHIVQHPDTGKPGDWLKGYDPHFSADTGQETHEWLYRTDISDRYYYAQGYVLCLLLDKWNPTYKRKLFTEGDFSLERLLAL